jgi:hypothetical protein
MTHQLPALAAGRCYESRVTRALCDGPKTPRQIAAVTKINPAQVPWAVTQANRLLAVPGWRITKSEGIYSISRSD